MTTVPENWILFVPVHVDGDNREIQLQRAAMPQILEGDPDPPVKVQPRTMLMRQGLDLTPPQPYFVHEEEISRAGTRLTQAYQRTRVTDGRVYTLLRVRRQTWRGEGSSGLAFDRFPRPRREADRQISGTYLNDDGASRAFTRSVSGEPGGLLRVVVQAKSSIGSARRAIRSELTGTPTAVA